MRILEDIIQSQITTDEEDLNDLQVGSDKVRAAVLEMSRRAGNQPQGDENAESKEEEAIMPAGKGTYGKKRGRPPKKKSATTTTKKTTKKKKGY